MARSRFWTGVRKAAQAASQVYQGVFSGRESTPMQRAWATGSTIGYQVANHYSQLNHNKSWNWVAIHAVGKQWAQTEVRAYDRSMESEPVMKSAAQDAPAEKRKAIQNHPAIKLLRRPNPLMGYAEFMYQVAQQFRLTGGCVIWEVRNKEDDPKPVELWVLPRAWLTFLPPTEQFPMGIWRVVNPRGMTGYWGNNKLAGGFWLDVRDTISFKWPHALYPGEPYSPLDACDMIMDIGEKSDNACVSSLQHAVRPGLVLSVDPKVNLGPDQISAIEKQLADLKAGENNAGKTLVIQGVTKDSLGTPLGDLDASNFRTQNQKFMMGVQGVPGMVAGIREDVGSYSGDAATIHTFTGMNIKPDTDNFADCLTRRWQRYWGEDFELEFIPRRMDDPILKQKTTDQLFAGLDKGACTVNEWRASLDLEPIPGGDEIRQPMMPAGMPGQDGGAGLPPFLGGDVDMQDDPASATDTGVKRPELQQAMNGSALPAFLMNGVH